jgi:hypothetical protein
MSTLFEIWNSTQTQLFSWLEKELNPLSEFGAKSVYKFETTEW